MQRGCAITSGSVWRCVIRCCTIKASKVSTKQAKKGGSHIEKTDDQLNEEEAFNDFQVVIQFNREKCWGLFELLNRAQNEK